MRLSTIRPLTMRMVSHIGRSARQPVGSTAEKPCSSSVPRCVPWPIHFTRRYYSLFNERRFDEAEALVDPNVSIREAVTAVLRASPATAKWPHVGMDLTVCNQIAAAAFDFVPDISDADAVSRVVS